MMNSDGQLLLWMGVGVFLLALGSETAWRRGWLPQWLARKILHFGAVGACALAPLCLQDLTLLRWIVVLVVPVLIYLVYTRQLFSEANGRHSWGIALFPLAYLWLLFLPDRILIIVPMGILAVSDAAAAIVGQLFARRYYQLTGDRKSLIGSLAFLVTALGVIWLSQSIYPDHWHLNDGLRNMEMVSYDDHWVWPKVTFLVIILTALEALGSRGLDNLLIPPAAALLLEHAAHLTPDPRSPFYVSDLELWVQLASLLAFGAVFIWFTVRRRSLSLDGAVMAAVIGLWVLFFAGPEALWPLFFFFISSTLLGKLTRKEKVISDVKHGKARDYRQVLCNGGIYALLATFGLDVFMVASLAVATADTWASEIGMYFRRPTYDLWRRKLTPVGLSGGVSWVGTLGGLAGAAAMAIVGILCLHWEMDIISMLAFTGIGFLGMLIDSLLGATLQARYQNEETGELTDIPTKILHSGYRRMSNDAVNLLSNVLTILLAAICCLLLFLSTR